MCRLYDSSSAGFEARSVFSWNEQAEMIGLNSG